MDEKLIRQVFAMLEQDRADKKLFSILERVVKEYEIGDSWATIGFLNGTLLAIRKSFTDFYLLILSDNKDDLYEKGIEDSDGDNEVRPMSSDRVMYYLSKIGKNNLQGK